MKIQKYFVADNEQIGWKQIEEMISDTYSIRSQIDKIIETVPTAKIKVTYNLEIEID